jgi:hypothetical protein
MANERPPLEEMTLRQLRRVASEYSVSRYSRMRKEQLIAAIKKAQGVQYISSPPAFTSGAQEEVGAAKFDVGQMDRSSGTLAEVDEGLAELPAGYGESRIVLMPRDPQWAYAYWDVSNEHKQALRRQGGVRLALRFYDVTDIDVSQQRPHSLQQYECDELAREWYLPVPVSDRDYTVEIGYLTVDARWLLLARSLPAHMPPVYPSDWIEDQFLTVDWEDDLRGKTMLALTSGKQGSKTADNHKLFELAQAAEVQRIAGSIFGSMQQVPEQAVSSYVLPSGVGMWGVSSYAVSSYAAAPSSYEVSSYSYGVSSYAVSSYAYGVSSYAVSSYAVPAVSVPTLSGVGAFQMMSGVGLTQSGVGMSGVGLLLPGAIPFPAIMSGIGMSGIGLAASMPPILPRKFWMIADAELIVYGATEPDATVTIGGRPIKLNSDGTFRFQMSFQDGVIDFPIMAVAADGEQMRSIHMKFTRQTSERNTNTKEEAIEEWLVS